ncbi:MAG: hypothetical protein FJX65_02055 [Alphaproteobacteria bacterium]|nr:hypothetical protein [Alphaproteobacteria bacterium]
MRTVLACLVVTAVAGTTIAGATWAAEPIVIACHVPQSRDPGVVYRIDVDGRTIRTVNAFDTPQQAFRITRIDDVLIVGQRENDSAILEFNRVLGQGRFSSDGKFFGAALDCAKAERRF